MVAKVFVYPDNYSVGSTVEFLEFGDPGNGDKGHCIPEGLCGVWGLLWFCGIPPWVSGLPGKFASHLISCVNPFSDLN